MSIWQFNAAVKGYVAANTTVEKGQFTSEEEKDDVWDWLQTQDIPTRKQLSNNIYLWDGKSFILDKIVKYEVD